MFTALLIEKGETGQTVALTSLDETDLPDGDVSIDVEYSRLNYKDGLAITGRAPGTVAVTSTSVGLRLRHRLFTGSAIGW